MAPSTAPRVTRRGFRSAPLPVREQADRLVRDFAGDTRSTAILAELRPASYCGPGSAGDRGSYTLSVSGNVGRNCFRLFTVETHP